MVMRIRWRRLFVIIGALVLLAAILAALLSLGRTGTLGLGRLRPGAVAEVKGGPLAPDIRGTVEFRQFGNGTLVTARITGLPISQPGNPPLGPHGFHIHEFGDCQVGDPLNPFTVAGEHWNPTNDPHPLHAGDLPVIFSNSGTARVEVYTDRFRPEDVVGRSIVIHENPDDFRTQPAGASGRRLACGLIVAPGR